VEEVIKMQNTDKYSNNKTKTTQEQNDETIDILFQDTEKITRKTFDIKYTHVIQGPYDKQQGKKLLQIMSHF
jgi:hypothetical protein